MIRNLIILLTFWFGLTTSINAEDQDTMPEAAVQMESYKFYAVVFDGLEEGKRANAIGHMSVGLGSVLRPEDLRATPYVSADGVTFSNISEWPFIVLRANLSKLRKLYEGVITDGTIPHAEFLETMRLGPTYKEQIEATKAKSTAENKILGITIFGTVSKLEPLVKKFSLLQ